MERHKGETSFWNNEFCLSTLEDVSKKIKTLDLERHPKTIKKKKCKKKRSKKSGRKSNMKSIKDQLIEDDDYPFPDVLPVEFEHSNFKLLCENKINWKMFVNPLKLKVVDEMFVDRLAQLHKLQNKTIEYEQCEFIGDDKSFISCDNVTRDSIPRECERWRMGLVTSSDVGKKPSSQSIQINSASRRFLPKPEKPIACGNELVPRNKFSKKHENLLPLRPRNSDHFVHFLNFTSQQTRITINTTVQDMTSKLKITRSTPRIRRDCVGQINGLLNFSRIPLPRGSMR